MSTDQIMAAEEVVRVNLDLPKRLADWLERKALERKQAGVDRRMAKSPIVVELIEAAMDGEPDGQEG